jgi:hypothetical protein
MALDHYVSQVHLKRFHSPAMGGKKMFAIRKSDLLEFTPDSRDVCRIDEGSTNSYLQDQRAIEDFLKQIEPNYNKAVANIVEQDLDSQSIFVIAGFIAYILTCSPAGMRIHKAPFEAVLGETARILDKQGEFEKPPGALGGESITELLEDKKIRFDVDPKYPQAVGISQVFSLTNTFGNSRWEILINEFADSPFFSSDFPVAIEVGQDASPINRVIPLTPTLAVRVYPDLTEEEGPPSFDFPRFARRVRKASRAEVRSINTLLVQGAETMVFFRDQLPWVRPFVARNATYKIQYRLERIPTESGTYILNSLVLEKN